MTSVSLRVLVVSPEYPPHVRGGLGTYVEALTSALPAVLAGPNGAASNSRATEDAAVVLVVPWRGDYRDTPLGVRLHEVRVTGANGQAEFWLRFGEQAEAEADKLPGPVDVIHCHDWMTVSVGLRLRQQLEAPLVLSVHLPQSQGPFRALERLGLFGADAVIVASKAVNWELPTGSPRWIVPGGVNLCRFSPEPPEARDGQPILFVGRFVAQKGVEVLLYALAILLRRAPSARLVLAGEGPQRFYLRRLARYLGISEQVHLVGWQTGDQLVQLYRQAAVVAVPSLYEPFGLVALEAMACGRPVVASATGGLKEIIGEDGQAGLLARPGDHLALAQQLAQLLDPELARTTGDSARRRAERYSWAESASRTVEVYQGARESERRAIRSTDLDGLIKEVGEKDKARAENLRDQLPHQ